MIIDKFQKYKNNGKTRVECIVDNSQKVLLECDIKYLDFVQDNYDGFLVLLLCVAMKQNKNIDIKGTISYKLYYNLKNHVMPIIKILHPDFHIINIKAKKYSEENFNGNGVGAGLSCGIDSLSCIEDYYFTECKSYKLTHLTNFFAGATKNRKVYENKLKNIENYISETNLDFLQVYTNFHKVNNLEHQYFHTLRNLAVPLFFQKLFRRYYYSSSFAFQNSKIVPGSGSITSAEPIIIPLLSTESTELLIHGAQYSRLRKTEIVAKNKLAQKYLDVCVHPSYYETIKERINCSKCFKCLRTCSTLDYYCDLDKFTEVFDLEIYNKYKKSFLEKLETTNPYDRELKSRYYKNDKLYLDAKHNITFQELDKMMPKEENIISNYNKIELTEDVKNNSNLESNNTILYNNYNNQFSNEEISYLLNRGLEIEETTDHSSNEQSSSHNNIINNSSNEVKDRYWFAFKKDWEFLKNANQIKALKDLTIKKNKNKHSSQLNENEKKNIQKGKLFKLEKDQTDKQYYKIFI